MIKTTYTCDKCGHEQETKDQMWDIGVSVRHHGGYPGISQSPISPYEKPKGEELWCRKCIEQMGLLPAAGGDPKAEPIKPPTLEDMVRDICREEMPNA